MCHTVKIHKHLLKNIERVTELELLLIETILIVVVLSSRIWVR
jgi:hypothetical protein